MATTTVQPRIRRTSSRGAWLAGLVVGVLAGVLSVEILLVGALLVVAFAVPALVIGPRLASLGGLLLGAGGVLGAVLRLAIVSCEAFDRGVNQGCTSPDDGPLFVVAAAAIGAGVVITGGAIAALRRAGRVRSH